MWKSQEVSDLSFVSCYFKSIFNFIFPNTLRIISPSFLIFYYDFPYIFKTNSK